jgi:hypothetical protein
MRKETVAEVVEQRSTRAVPRTTPKMAPAESVRTKAAAIGTTCKKIIVRPNRR